MFLNSNSKGKSIFKSIMTVIVSSLVTGVILLTILPYFSDKIIPNRGENEESEFEARNIRQDVGYKPENLAVQSGSFDVTQIASAVIPSVVGISTAVVSEYNLFRSTNEQRWSVGSGVIVSEDGYILTNHHVIDGGSGRIVVTLDNGSTVEADRKWADPTLDIAIIKINRKGLNPASLGDSNGLRVGEPAVAIGNPLGLQFQRSVTAGIVSAVNRTIRVSTDGGENYMEGLIQTDASINPGNSGGPLINSKGQVIGINTIKVTTAEAMGFAIPINVCKPVVSKFSKDGDYSTPYMGLFAYDGTVARYVKRDSNMDRGIYVARIDATSPAYKAGVRIGDIITHVGDEEVNTMIELVEKIYECGVGNECAITYIRDGNPRRVSFVLENKTKDGVTR